MAAEASGKTEEFIEANHSSIVKLKEELINKYPKLENINFKIAVNHAIVDEELVLIGNEEIALLPPFAGG
jgi:molybdopterin synthase sulfur carrier subunit